MGNKNAIIYNDKKRKFIIQTICFDKFGKDFRILGF